MPSGSPAELNSILVAQGAAASHLSRIALLRDFAERSPNCVALALVGSFAQKCGDRISDLDLCAFVTPGAEEQVVQEVHAILQSTDILNVYGQSSPRHFAFKKYVFLDFSSCEFYAFSTETEFKLRRPFISIWDPTDHLLSLVVDQPPPRHETFEPYQHGNEGLVWELVDCIKWLCRGRTELATRYLIRLGRALEHNGVA
jgi:hypothetical protein